MYLYVYFLISNIKYHLNISDNDHLIEINKNANLLRDILLLILVVTITTTIIHIGFMDNYYTNDNTNQKNNIQLAPLQVNYGQPYKKILEESKNTI